MRKLLKIVLGIWLLTPVVLAAFTLIVIALVISSVF
jgi:hypothetical protein